MFTGIIQTTGRVQKWIPVKSGGKLFIKPKQVFRGVKVGESIAVNGCCLTVVSGRKGILEFDVSDETLRKTTMGRFQNQQIINLERAMTLGDRLGGHLVLGHVDAVGQILEIKTHAGSVEFVVSYPKKFSRLLINKGSITVDGISLTVCDLEKNRLSVFVIPHTLKVTHLSTLKKGEAVNLEFDVVGKYVTGLRS